jgi:hypothetical protein
MKRFIMSVFHLGDGSNPYAGRFPGDSGEDMLDSEVELEDFDVALRLLGDLNTEALAQLLLSDPGEIDLPQRGLTAVTAQSELPLSFTAAATPHPPLLPFSATAPPQLPASESTAAERLMPNLVNVAAPLTIGGPYWGAELAWKRTAKTAKERKTNEHESDQDGDDETERSRRRRAAWRKYNETALERRLKEQD